MSVPLLQLRLGEEVPAGDLQRLPDGNPQGLRDRTALRDGEVLGLHQVLQVCAELFIPFETLPINVFFLNNIASCVLFKEVKLFMFYFFIIILICGKL